MEQKAENGDITGFLTLIFRDIDSLESKTMYAELKKLNIRSDVEDKKYLKICITVFLILKTLLDKLRELSVILKSLRSRA